MNGAAAVSDERARALADEIVQRAEYADWQAFRLRSQLVERIIEWLRAAAAWFDALRFESPGLYWTLLVGLLLIAALLMTHVVWSIRVALSASRRKDAVRAEPHAHRFADEAAALADDGRFLDAAHRLHLAAIDLLLQRRVVDLSRFEPNRILRRRLREARLPAAERDDLLGLLDRLEMRWFRDRTEDRELYESWRRLYARLEGMPA